MNRQQILDLYDWAAGVCFRHPERGEVLTALVKTLHPPGHAEHDLRVCEDCVVAIEDARRETAARTGGTYEPGHVGEAST
ncbi:hypothetical protein ACFWIO_18935 [Streptomyces diastatochromogenes]|uniref:hypothetical protein n=1 Tax=Streptomyces diastatochromogenes TaxID=42236 RepID=UPI00364A77A8